MLKRALLLLSAVTFFGAGAQAQYKCITDEVNQKLKEKYPQIAINEEIMRQEIEQRLAMKQYAKTTSHDTVYYNIPIVVHIIHDYGDENLTDNAIFNAVKD